MTEVGHAMTGATIGILCMPEYSIAKQRVLHITAFMLIATIPDWPFKNWGHDRYYFSHSLFTTLFFISLAILALMTFGKARTKIGNWPVVMGGTSAWLSHLLLDSFYNHGKGIAIFWPFSKARLALPIPWFDLGVGSPSHILHVVFIEFLSYFPLLILAILIRQK